MGRLLGLAGLIFAAPSCGEDDDGDIRPTNGGSGAVTTGGEGGEVAQDGEAGNAGAPAGGGEAGAGGGAATGTAGSAGSSDGAAGSAGASAGGAPGEGPCDPATTGNWAFGNDNLYMTVVDGCVISNFCSIDEGIHTQGTLSGSELHLDSVGGQSLSFSYIFLGDTLIIVDGYESIDLPLGRTNEPLPDACPPP